MGAFTISETVEINSSKEALFEYVMNIEFLPEWSNAIVAIRDFSGAPIGVGSTWVDVSKFMGREFSSNNEVVEFNEGNYCVYKIDGSAFEGLNTFAVGSTEDDKATFTLSADGETKGFIAAMATTLLRGQAHSQMRKDLANLKSIIEAQSA
jgi:uncharacterized membrane protein